MERHAAVSAERLPPPRWAAALPLAEPHALEASASVFGGLSALREAAFGQDDRPPLLPPPPPSPFQPQQAASDPPFYFAPFPALPPPRPDGRRFDPPPNAADALGAKQLALERARPETAAAAASLGPPRRASDEERKAKHREAQRRFVRRKKVAMQQLRELARALEKQFELLQVADERRRLEAENAALQSQVRLGAEAQDRETQDREAQDRKRSGAEASDESSPAERCERLKVAPLPGWEFREFAW